MSKTMMQWSLLVLLVNIVLVTGEHYQRIPQEYIHIKGEDNITIIKFVVCSPNKYEGQTIGQGQDECEGQGLYQVNNCSLEFNSTSTELFFTNTTSNVTGGDWEDTVLYWTLLEMSNSNSTIQIRPGSLSLSNLILKGVFTFDLHCGTRDELEITEMSPVVTQVTQEFNWYIIGVLGLMNLVQAIGVIIYCGYRRRKSKLVQLSSLTVESNSPKKNCCKREYKEFWTLGHLNRANKRTSKPLTEERPNENYTRNRLSSLTRSIFKKQKCQKHLYVNEEELRNMGWNPKEMRPGSTQSAESYVDMSNHPCKKPNCSDADLKGEQLKTQPLKAGPWT